MTFCTHVGEWPGWVGESSRLIIKKHKYNKNIIIISSIMTGSITKGRRQKIMPEKGAARNSGSLSFRQGGKRRSWLAKDTSDGVEGGCDCRQVGLPTNSWIAHLAARAATRTKNARVPSDELCSLKKQTKVPGWVNRKIPCKNRVFDQFFYGKAKRINRQPMNQFKSTKLYSILMLFEILVYIKFEPYV